MNSLSTLLLTTFGAVTLSGANAEAPSTKPPGKIDQLQFRSFSVGLPDTGHFAGVAMADLNRDGKAELLSGRREDGKGLFVFTFEEGAWQTQQITPQGDYGGVALADVTGDGTPDLLAMKTAGPTKGLEIFETKVAGKRIAFAPMPSPYSSRGGDDLDIGDLDNDGDLDIVLSSRGDRVLVNGGKGTAFETIELDTGVYEDTGIVLADVNGDKLPDVLSANHPGENVRLFLGKSITPPAFSERHTTGLPQDNDIGFKIAAADINGDGHVDLAVGTNGGLRLFHGNSCRGVEKSWWTEQPFAGRSRVTIQPVFADLDRDGHPDLVYTSEEGIHVRLNNGKGAFGDRLTGKDIPIDGKYSGCCVADWDQDGDLDIAISSFQGHGIRLLRSEPDSL